MLAMTVVMAEAKKKAVVEEGLENNMMAVDWSGKEQMEGTKTKTEGKKTQHCNYLFTF